MLNMQKLKIRQIAMLSAMLLLFFTSGMAQYKDYKLSPNGDTLNATDNKGLKQGKWVVHVDEVRGEPGYEEEGVFKNGGKEGTWRKYNLNGDIIAIENYRLGGKHGIQQYFTFLGDLVREESWRGYNPDAPYDTIPVYGTSSNEIVSFKIVKAEQYSVKHGEWKYYEPGSGRLLKKEEYSINRLVVPGDNNAVAADVPKAEKKKPEKTPEMLEWEKKNKGKKKALRDGRTGM
jgi:antitoxin component YwqK of YwqJK toxin-antitoxin module